METSVIEKKYADGSSKWDVVFLAGGQRVTITAYDQAAAYAIQAVLHDRAKYGRVPA